MKNSIRTVTLGVVFTIFLLPGWVAAQTSIPDTQTRRDIHSALVGDKTLPYCAHVIRVNAQDGQIVLEGHVHTKEQKNKVAQKAEAIAGDKNVVNNVVVDNHVKDVQVAEEKAQ